ncbi:zinc finger CCCH domain-containing protein 13-like isoform X3 [Pomacea canaliculata]|uniref:zinc finger CCCH domain-containing protein 13-like isoform X3 n=1 Tax=Pomacea canaliculata TaxID=400727 RepID=UPI000D735EEC|nr:zinc finger CCCH domain-containing protein 13-like isoform X3 [Pomacea canaliculata]
MSSNTKRRVTVETGMSEDSEKRKPSVFERLGPGAGQRKYSEYDAGSSEREKKCRQFMMTGECPYGPSCKYKHLQLSRKSKNSRDGEGSPEDMKLKFKGQQSERSSEKQHRDSDSESPDVHGKSGRSRRDKETKIKSQVVVKKSSGNHGSDDSDASNDSNWFDSLDYKKEPELEQKRQQIQRALSQLEEDAMENITIQKKAPVPVAHHTQSGSESSPDQAKTSRRPPVGGGRGESPSEMRPFSPGGKKKEKKKPRTRSPADPDALAREKKQYATSPGPSPDKGKEHRKKHDVEEQSGHKKHKKNKKEKKHSLSPQPESGKKKEKIVEEPEAEVTRLQTSAKGFSKVASPPPAHSKRSRSSSPESLSPHKLKDKGQTKSKSKKKKARGNKGESRGSTAEGSTKAKKWLSPLAKTLKLKKAKNTSGVPEIKEMIEDDEAAKRRSPTPQPSRRSQSQEFLAEDPMPPSRHQGISRETSQTRGRSTEKRNKKRKNKRTPSPLSQSSDRAGRRGDTKDVKKRTGDNLPAKDNRKESVEDKRKRGMVSPQQSELYSPSQLERESPARESLQTGRNRHGGLGEARGGDRGETGREEDRRAERDSRRPDKFESRSQPSNADQSSSDRYTRRDGEGFEQHGQERGRYDISRDARTQELGTDREQRGRGSSRYDREPLPPRDHPRGDGAGWDSSFDRQTERGKNGRDPSRDGRDSRDLPHDPGRDRTHGIGRDRSDTRDSRSNNRDAQLDAWHWLSGSRFGMGTYPADAQRRGAIPWDGGNRAGDWPDRPEAQPDVRLDDRAREGRMTATGGSSGSSGSAGRIYRDDSRDSRLGDRHGRDAPVESRQGQLDRVDNRSERGDGRLDRDSRLDRSDGRADRGERNTDRGTSRGDSQADRRRGGGQASPFDQRGAKPGWGSGMSQSSSRGDLRSLVDEGRGYEYDRRLGLGRDSQTGKTADRDSLGSRGGERDVPGGRAPDRDGPGGRNGDRELQMGREGDRNLPMVRGGDRTVPIGRQGERDSQLGRVSDRLERDRELGGSSRERFVARDGVTIDIRQMRDDRAFPDDFPDPLHEHRVDQIDRYDAELREGRNVRGRALSPQENKLSKGGRGFDDDRGQSRGSANERGVRDRGVSRSYDYDLRDQDPRLVPDLLHEPDSSLRRLPVSLPREEHRGGRGEAYESRSGRESGLGDSRDSRGRREPRETELVREAESSMPSRVGRESAKESVREGPKDTAWEGRESARDIGRDFPRDTISQTGRLDGRRGRISPTSESFVDPDRSRERDRERDFWGHDSRRKERSPRRDGVSRGWSPSDGDKSKVPTKLQDDLVACETEPSRRQEKKESEKRLYDEPERGRPKDREEVGEVMSAHVTDVRDTSSPRRRKEQGDTTVKDRDSQSEGRRSPSRNRRREKTPLSLTRSSSADQRQAKRTRSLSPRQSSTQRGGSPSSVSKLAVEKPKSPTSKSASSRSPSRKRGHHESESTQSPLLRIGQRGRSRTPIGAKRKRGASSRSPAPGAKDDTKSPVPKRLREESRSPTRRNSRHPSPAGSQHSHCSQGSLDRRRRLPSSYTEGDRYHRDSPARRERDRDREREVLPVVGQERSMESQEEKDLDPQRKRGWSPVRALPRAVSHSDRNKRKRRGNDGDWSDLEMDMVIKEDFRQGVSRLGVPDIQSTIPDSSVDILDMPKSDSSKLLPPLVSSTTPIYPADISSRTDRRPVSSIVGGRGIDDYGRGPLDAWGDRYDDRRDGISRGRVDSVASANPDSDQRGEMPSSHEAAEDSKDTNLSITLPSDEGYEEISSDEDDFANEDGEKQNQNSIVSVLDIDWASLAKEPVAKPNTGSLAKRFHPSTVFHEIGISRSFAGDELFNKVKEICEKGIEDDTERKEAGVKSEDKENKAASSKDTRSLSLLHDVPALHLAAVRQRHDRANLLKNVGPFRRGLCARRDLEIRRQLCKVDKVYEQPAVFPTHVMDTDLCKLSIQLFRQGRDYADRKNSECDIKGDLTL